MIGPLEVLILVLILLIVFGAYKRLPQLGRSAGTGARKGGEKAKELAAQAHRRAEEVDTAKISKSVGDGIREAREVRDAVRGGGGEADAAKQKPDPNDER